MTGKGPSSLTVSSSTSLSDMEDQRRSGTYGYSRNSFDSDRDQEQSMLLKYLKEIEKQQQEAAHKSDGNKVRKYLIMFGGALMLAIVLFLTSWAGSVTGIVTASTRVYDMRSYDISHDEMEKMMAQWRRGRTIILQYKASDEQNDNEMHLALSAHSSGASWQIDKSTAQHDVEYIYHVPGQQVAAFRCSYSIGCKLYRDSS